MLTAAPLADSAVTIHSHYKSQQQYVKLEIHVTMVIRSL